MSLTVAEAELLAQSWQLALRAERKSPQTLKAYGDGVRAYLTWCAAAPVEPFVRASLNLWVAELLENGAAASTARSRQLAVRRLTSWLTDEGELPSDLANGQAIVRRGKGGKGRMVPFGPQTSLAIDRYLRLRRAHRLAHTDALWLGDRGKQFTYDALHKTLRLRADQAGIVGFHPHKLRHTAAHRWLAAGGSEGGLMAVAGWTRPDMLMRYTKAQAAARAADEARKLNLGDV